ncbi:hypothetical protein HDU88_007087 [Geranomyces variabilis]|nr:hypothetical protein HDU88_007087 [Geranomyces variabilis]
MAQHQQRRLMPQSRERTSQKNLLHGGVLFTSSTVNADFLTGFGSLWATDCEKVIQMGDHYPEQRPVEHGELMRQARDLMARRQFLAAKRCLNRAADELWISGLSRESAVANEKRRDMLVPIMCLSAKCRLALSEKHMSVSDVDRALEDVELLLSGSIFPLEEIKADTLADLRNMEKQAKLQKARLSYDLPVHATQSVARSTNNNKKKKKKQATKKDEPALMVTLTERLLSQEVAKNTSSSDDGCTICLTGWADFATITLAVVPPCQHATCAPCLSRFHKSCKTSFESDTSAERAKVPFSCTLCRAAFPDSLVTTAAHVSVQSNLVPACKELPQHLGVSDPDDRHRLLTSLLTVHNFELPQVTDILFSMVGVGTTTAVRDLTHDDKQRIYEEAREPVRRLAEEHRQLRAKLARSYETDHPEWRATLARARDVAESLEQARDNAAAHIYERVNAAGKMGRAAPNGRAPVHVDLHGLHEDEARRTLIDFVFPTLPVLKMVNVITGKGTHSQDGEGVLRGLVKTLTVEHGFRVEKNKNSGVLTLRA